LTSTILPGRKTQQQHTRISTTDLLATNRKAVNTFESNVVRTFGAEFSPHRFWILSGQNYLFSYQFIFGITASSTGDDFEVTRFSS